MYSYEYTPSLCQMKKNFKSHRPILHSPSNGILNNERPRQIYNNSRAMEPTPMGPPHVIQVVDRIPITEACHRLFETGADADTRSLWWDTLYPLISKIHVGTLSGQKSWGVAGEIPTGTFPNNTDVNVPGMDFWDLASKKDRKQTPSSPRYDKGKVDSDEFHATKKIVTMGRTTTFAGVFSHPKNLKVASETRKPMKRASQLKLRCKHANAWEQKFQEICDYKERYGTCHVPHNWQESPTLAKWVKRHRYQYKLRQEGKQTALTAERQEALERLGFVWQCHDSAWEERFAELQEFHRVHGHCRVPTVDGGSYYSPQLSCWVQCQRRQCRLFRSGVERSFMTEERAQKLDSLGFVWEPRGGSSSYQKENKGR
jgi:hypothetical protein